MTEIDRDAWRKRRRAKEISLSEIAAHIKETIGNCTYNHLSQWEKKEGYQVAADKIEAYMKYIESK